MNFRKKLSIYHVRLHFILYEKCVQLLINHSAAPQRQALTHPWTRSFLETQISLLTLNFLDLEEVRCSTKPFRLSAAIAI